MIPISRPKKVLASARLKTSIGLVSDLPSLFRSAPESCLGWAYFFGALWGLGGLTFGLTMRYLGIALGMAVALGYCAAFGTLMPPLFRGELEGVARTTADRQS